MLVEAGEIVAVCKIWEFTPQELASNAWACATLAQAVLAQ